MYTHASPIVSFTGSVIKFMSRNIIDFVESVFDSLGGIGWSRGLGYTFLLRSSYFVVLSDFAVNRLMKF
jgi:hypothetical protein